MKERQRVAAESLTRAVEELHGEAVSFLQKLISFDTTNEDQGVFGKEGEAQQWLSKHLGEFGLTTRMFEPHSSAISKYRGFSSGHEYRDRPNLVATLRGKGGGRSILLNSHIDTMPFGPLQYWTHEPLAGEVEDGRIYGRGACDAKGCLATAIMAVRSIQRANIDLGGDVIIESVVDEEGGGNGTLACISEGYTADGAIVLEPTKLTPFIGHMGWMFFNIVTVGRATHGSIKASGVNAIEPMVRIIGKLQELENNWQSENSNLLFPRSTINIGQIRGGIAGSVVPDRCEMNICVHFYPNGDADARARNVEEQVRNAILSAGSGTESASIQPPAISKYQDGDPYSIDPDHALAKVLIEHAQRSGGKRLQPAGAPFGCDARLIQLNSGIPTVIFGPGSIEQAHAADEYLEIDQYLSAVLTVASSIFDWCSV